MVTDSGCGSHGSHIMKVQRRTQPEKRSWVSQIPQPCYSEKLFVTSATNLSCSWEEEKAQWKRHVTRAQQLYLTGHWLFWEANQKLVPRSTKSKCYSDVTKMMIFYDYYTTRGNVCFQILTQAGTKFPQKYYQGLCCKFYEILSLSLIISWNFEFKIFF